MKKILTLVLIILGSHAFAQDSLKKYNNIRTETTTSGMAVLGSWGVVNLGVGAVGWNSSTTSESRYFYQMNTIWGVVNFGTALLSYESLQNKKKKHLTAAETLQEQEKIEKIFRINEGLDVAYLGAGIYLKLVGDHRNSPIMKGYGESVIMQGTFLLIFDGIMYHNEKGNGGKLRHFLEKHPVTFNGKQVGMIFNM
jgi:hypothetical protein